MNLYHRTTAENVHSIMQNGFRDAIGYYLMTAQVTGVFFSDYPLTCNEGAKGNDLLLIDIPEQLITDFEIEEEGKPYREFVLPAKLVNKYGPPVHLTEEQDEPPNTGQ